MWGAVSVSVDIPEKNLCGGEIVIGFYGLWRDATIEDIQKAITRCQELGYQLIYDDSRMIPWCITTNHGNLILRSYSLRKLMWILECEKLCPLP
jgi:hypothetical protein